MKEINFATYLLITLSAITGCTKDTADQSSPVANAGPDIRLEIPITNTTLAGSASDANDDIKEYNWTKIAGPESYLLEWPNNLSPKLVWLEEGDYEFEFTATDKNRLFDKDTMKITVFSTLKKYVLQNLTPNALGFSIAQIPSEVKDNIKWVFAKSVGRSEQADAGPAPGIDYNWGGYYYELLAGNMISVFGGSQTSNLKITIYY